MPVGHVLNTLSELENCKALTHITGSERRDLKWDIISQVCKASSLKPCAVMDSCV